MPPACAGLFASCSHRDDFFAQDALVRRAAACETMADTLIRQRHRRQCPNRFTAEQRSSTKKRCDVENQPRPNAQTAMVGCL